MTSSGNGLTYDQFLISVYNTKKDELNNGNRFYTWGSDKFSWYTQSGYTRQLNYKDREYCYIAF